MEDELLTIDDVAKNLKVSEATVYRLMREGELPVVKKGRKFTRIQESDLQAFILRHKKEI